MVLFDVLTSRRKWKTPVCSSKYYNVLSSLSSSRVLFLNSRKLDFFGSACVRFLLAFACNGLIKQTFFHFGIRIHFMFVLDFVRRLNRCWCFVELKWFYNGSDERKMWMEHGEQKSMKTRTNNLSGAWMGEGKIRIGHWFFEIIRLSCQKEASESERQYRLRDSRFIIVVDLISKVLLGKPENNKIIRQS